MKYFYRISDNSYKKLKLPGATKFFCLENFLNNVNSNPTIFADNCSDLTIDYLKSKNLEIIQSNKGNAGALRASIELALDLSDDEIVYFCEDDYLHKPIKDNIFKEGLELARYVSLYDHPDKYEKEYKFGEWTQVFKTPNSHWKYSKSTTMTFATNVKTLKNDYVVWEEGTSGFHPQDHNIFTKLKYGCLVTSIPGQSCHVDLTYSGVKNKLLIEEWAFDILEKNLLDSISSKTNESFSVNESNRLRKLIELEIIYNSL